MASNRRQAETGEERTCFYCKKPITFKRDKYWYTEDGKKFCPEGRPEGTVHSVIGIAWAPQRYMVPKTD
jgi:hypothetical protein